VRLRGIFTGKRGKRLGLASAIIPLTGYVIQDLRKPDSIIKALTQRARAYLTERIAERRKRIDHVGRVEIVNTTADEADSQENPLKKEDSDARRR
jgi:hypothetical protein